MSNVVFGTRSKPAPKIAENEYTEAVKTLIALTDEWNESGAKEDQPSFTVTVPVEDEGKTRVKIQTAARVNKKTARLVDFDRTAVVSAGLDEDGEPIEEGEVTFTVIITKPQKARRGAGRKTASAPVEADQDGAEPATA